MNTHICKPKNNMERFDNNNDTFLIMYCLENEFRFVIKKTFDAK